MQILWEPDKGLLFAVQWARVCVCDRGLHASVSLCSSSQHLFTFAIVLFLSFFVSFVSGLSVLLSVGSHFVFLCWFPSWWRHMHARKCTCGYFKVYCRDMGFVHSPFFKYISGALRVLFLNYLRGVVAWLWLNIIPSVVSLWPVRRPWDCYWLINKVSGSGLGLVNLILYCTANSPDRLGWLVES